MKKVLLTSTALVMTAGFAYAEVSAGVSISGSAEIGVKDEDDGADIKFHNDLDMDINFAGETDGGLAFGASIDLDEVNNGISADSGPAAAFLSYGGFRLDMGDVDGAFDLVNLETTLFTSINDDHTSHAGFNGGDAMDGHLDGQIATFQYTGVPGLLLAVSAEVGDGPDDDETYGVGIRYTFDLASVSLTGSLGYQSGSYGFETDLKASDLDDALGLAPGTLQAATGATGGNVDGFGGDTDLWGVSLEAEFDMGLTARLNYQDLDGTLDTGSVVLNDAIATTVAVLDTDIEWTFWGVVVGYETGPFAIEVNYGTYDADFGVDGSADADGWGLAVMYDLGGGAIAQLGYGSGDDFAGESKDTWSAGLALSF